MVTLPAVPSPAVATMTRCEPLFRPAPAVAVMPPVVASAGDAQAAEALASGSISDCAENGFVR